jgi:hypothetical protein
MARNESPQGETRYQRLDRLIEQGLCGLLPLDFSCLCPRLNGPERPHADHPGRVGFLTCNGCQYNTDLFFTNRVCTHPQARQVAARWLAEAIRTWEEQHTLTSPARPEEADQAIRLQVPLPPSCPDPPKQEGPTQLSMF